AKFVDYDNWKKFMPRSFKPLKGPTGRLVPGARVSIRISTGLLPMFASLKVARVEADREITWRGGVPGVLVGEHSFLFDDEGDGKTRVRSEETWSGALTRVGAVAERIRVQAERIGAAQIASFAKWIEGAANADSPQIDA